MLRSLFVLPLVFAPAVVARGADPEWAEYVSKDGKFKATFPGKVTTRENKQPTAATTHTTRASIGEDRLFTVVYLDAPAPFPADKLDDKLDELANTAKGKQLSKKKVTVGKDKVPGVETVITADNFVMRTRYVISGSRVSIVGVVGKAKDDVTTKEADKFLESFELTK